jgi:hypothetical protein
LIWLLLLSLDMTNESVIFRIIGRYSGKSAGSALNRIV